MPESRLAKRMTKHSMPLVPALEVLRDHRGESVVLTTMGSAREWPRLSENPLDFAYIPSSMGEGHALGLGLALALPEREVIVVNGDGCMWMNLGGLVTVVASGAANYTLLVINNGVYEVTGGQRTAAATRGIDFAPLARHVGFTTVAAFGDLPNWQAEAGNVLHRAGPRFIELFVEPDRETYHLVPPGHTAQRLARLRTHLGVEQR